MCCSSVNQHCGQEQVLMKRDFRPLPFVEITNSVGSLMLKNAKHRLVGENKNNACLCTVSVLPLEPIVLESMHRIHLLRYVAQALWSVAPIQPGNHTIG